MSWHRLATTILVILLTSSAAAQNAGPTGEFFKDPPRCVVVLSAPSVGHVVAAERMAEALARHLSGRFNRVIQPGERRRLVRRMAVDLSHPADARHFAAAQACPGLLRWQILRAGEDNAVVWSQKHLSLSAELVRARDGAVLWRAGAAAERSSGDPPLSLFSLPLALIRAAEFQTDDDAVASMLDDVARRLFASLPDVR